MRGTSGEPGDYGAGDATLSGYFGKYPPNAIDPFGLLSEPQDHHWFPRFGGDGQAKVDKICPKVKVDINLFTTALYDSERDSPHWLLSHGDSLHPRYNDQVEAVYECAASG